MCICVIAFTQLSTHQRDRFSLFSQRFLTQHRHSITEVTSADRCCSQVYKQEWRKSAFRSQKFNRNLCILLSANSSRKVENPRCLQVFIPPGLTFSSRASQFWAAEQQPCPLTQQMSFFFVLIERPPAAEVTYRAGDILLSSCKQISWKYLNKRC